jgi:hypothetical protein
MHPISQTTKTPEASPAWPKHYTVGELAKMWGFGRTTVRRWFEDEPGVLRLGEARIRRHRKKPYVSLRIPESVAWRVYNRHLEAT